MIQLTYGTDLVIVKTLRTKLSSGYRINILTKGIVSNSNSMSSISNATNSILSGNNGKFSPHVKQMTAAF